MWRRFLCWLGFHKKETIEIGGLTKEYDTGKPVTLYYNICVHCKDGHPFITGEW